MVQHCRLQITTGTAAYQNEILLLPPFSQIVIIPLAESASSVRTMPRFAVLFLLVLSVIGCQTASRGPQPTILVHSSPLLSPQPAVSAKKFWYRTARFLQPLMPDNGNSTAESDSRLAAGHSPSDILPINHTSHPLYQAGSIFPSQHLVHQNQMDSVSIAETTANIHVPLARPNSQPNNPLQIQSGDSEAFQSLLREIAIVPPEKRNVDDVKLAELLAPVRNDIMDSDIEAEYIALLRKRILPESVLSKSAAPLPGAELAEMRRSAHAPVRNQEPEWNNDDTDNESIVAQNTMPMPKPVYPDLVQLPGAVPAVVQTSYQSQSVPPSVAPQTSNIASHGAGDWQAPTRAAIDQLRYAIEQTPNGRTVSNEMRLRTLEVLLGNKSEAVKPILSADKAVNDFMAHQVLGFAELLDDSLPNNQSRYGSAAYRFSEGLTELQNLCSIKLKNVTFAIDWFGYGQFVVRDNQEFYPGEDFYVYMEIEYPSVRPIPDGFEAKYTISYEIRDAHTRVVFRQEAEEQWDRTLSRKRDYWFPLRGKIPASLAPGQYHLRINVTDLNDDSMQYAEEQIPFRVAPSASATTGTAK